MELVCLGGDAELKGPKHTAKIGIPRAFASGEPWKQPQPVPTVNHIRPYRWCSPSRIGRQTMFPAHSTPRGTGASLFNDKMSARGVVVIFVGQQNVAQMAFAEHYDMINPFPPD